MTWNPAGYNIYLVGFMAAGKTTIGLELARLLGRVFVDLDQEIERRLGKAIAELFEHPGEASFRGLESEVLRELSGQPGRVIALGGGAFTNAENRERVRATGIAVWLEVPFSLLLDRLRDARDRPLNSSPEQLELLYQSRLPDYRSADLCLQLLDPDPRASALMVMHALEQRDQGLLHAQSDPAASA